MIARSHSGTRSQPRAVPHGTLAWLAVVRAYNLCDAVLGGRLAALGLRVGEHEVLANLANAPGMTQQELAAHCFVAKSGVSMLLAQMEGLGLVTREVDASDGRVKRLFLSATGRALAAKTLKVQDDVVGAMAAGVTPAELAAVAAVMERVCTQLDALRADVKPARSASR